MSSDEDAKQGLKRTAMLLTAQELERLAYGGVRNTVLPPAGSAVQSLRVHLSRITGHLGGRPVPAFRERMNSALQALRGATPTLFVDKLCEQLAFERTGSRLYAGLLLKTYALGTYAGGPSPERLLELHNQELEHLSLVREGILMLGADPTAMTPSGEVAGLQSLGLIQTVDNPASTLPDAVRAALVSELINNTGWALLVDLAGELGPPGMKHAFREVLHVEARHLAEVTVWVANGTLTQAPPAGVPRPSHG